VERISAVCKPLDVICSEELTEILRLAEAVEPTESLTWNVTGNVPPAVGVP